MTRSIDRGGSWHPLIELGLARLREFAREPEAIFWAFIFPILMSVSLAVAFPIALAAVDQYNLYVPAADLALATQFSTYAPAFLVAGIASFVAALVTIVKLIQRIDRGPAA